MRKTDAPSVTPDEDGPFQAREEGFVGDSFFLTDEPQVFLRV